MALLAAVACPHPVMAAPFKQSLALQGVSFSVNASGDGSQQTLLVTTTGKGKRWPVIRETVDGQVVGTEVQDFNRDGLPELLVYLTSAGSGSYGSVLSWVTTKKGTLQPINMPDLSGLTAKGYQGHDSFAVVEETLSRRFPIYKPGDTNAKPTGGLRQVNYKLVPGEASWQWKQVSVYTF
jgi:uncharacterized protein YidB (DUF937 family)